MRSARSRHTATVSTVDTDHPVVSIDTLDVTIVIRLRGEPELATAPSADASVGIVADYGPTTIILDLTDVPFCVSAFITVLVKAYNAVRRSGQRRIELHNPTTRASGSWIGPGSAS